MNALGRRMRKRAEDNPIATQDHVKRGLAMPPDGGKRGIPPPSRLKSSSSSKVQVCNVKERQELLEDQTDFCLTIVAVP